MKKKIELEDLGADKIAEIAARATRRAFDRSFEHCKSILIARDGWLVRVDRNGDIVERVRKL